MISQHKKISLAIALVLLLALGTFLALQDRKPQQAADFGCNILKNSGFELASQEELPQDWLPEAYLNAPGISEFSLIKGQSGQGVRIENHDANDARYRQSAAVRPDTNYCLSAMVRTTCQGGRGANLSIGDIYVFSQPLFDTNGAWQKVELYGKTGKNQTSLTVLARLGGYSGESAGWAEFDDVRLAAVNQVPQGAVVESWDALPAQPAAVADEVGDQPAHPAWPWLLALTAGYVVFGLYMARRLENHQLQTPQPNQPSNSWLPLALLLLGAFALRMAVAFLIPGYGVDIGCFTAWADQMAQVGPGGFYLSGMFSDYPPGYMLVLWPLGVIGRALGGTSEQLVKLPSILCDVGLVWVLYHYARRFLTGRAALCLAGLYALHPVTLAAGAAWGQVDSVPALLLLLVVILAIDGRWHWAIPVYTLAVLMKPQSLMFGPLGLAALMIDLVVSRDRNKWLRFGIGLGLGAVLAVVVVWPFASKMENPLQWLTGLYSGTMNYYNKGTVNALNLFFAFDKNWVDVKEQAPWLLRLTGALSLAIPVVWHVVGEHARNAVKAQGNKAISDAKTSLRHKLLLASLVPVFICVLLPMSMRVTGMLLMASVFCIIVVLLWFGRDLRLLPLLGACLLFSFCALGVMMHERYAFACAALLLAAYAWQRDKRLMLFFLGASALIFLNVGIVLDRGIRIGGSQGHLHAPAFGIQSDSMLLEYIVSWLTVAASSYGVYVACTLSRAKAQVQAFTPLRPADKEGIRATPLTPAFVPGRSDRRDGLIILVIMLLYAIVALVNLGATQAPQTAWLSTDSRRQVILSLDKEDDFQLLYYPGINGRDTDFTIEVSNDQQTWVSTPGRVLPGDCFSWRYQTTAFDSGAGLKFGGERVTHHGRYVRLSTPSIGLMLMEVQLRDAQTGAVLPVRAQQGAQALVDEQGVFSGAPSWFNSMYFDEIYHARTAYEQLNAIRNQQPNSIYETSHPPLGKVLMTFSLMAFGMTPFGWRFAGALAGVLMLPGMYLLGRLFTRRRWGGVLAALLMAFDCMHFAQTRIATIDSFVTLFIIWAYYFMFRYALLAGGQTPLRQSPRLLFFSGLCMGLAVASKWTGVYAGLGLAVIFFWALGRSLRREEGQGVAGDHLPRIDSAKWWSWRSPAMVTLLWCVVFFVLMPVLIYYLSFLPVFMRTPGGLTVEKVLNANRSMLSYHATPGLGMDHFFYSPWYQWPLSLKPMWFYSGEKTAATGSTILTFGNPAVWWTGLVGIILLLVKWLRGHMVFKPFGFSLRSHNGDVRPALVLLAFLAQYLPWILVPRGTYIYHYFPSVPFIILAICVVYDDATQRKPRLAQWGALGLLAAALILFILFFPYISGVRVDQAWLNLMNWFPGWLYY